MAFTDSKGSRQSRQRWRALQEVEEKREISSVLGEEQWGQRGAGGERKRGIGAEEREERGEGGAMPAARSFLWPVGVMSAEDQGGEREVRTSAMNPAAVSAVTMSVWMEARAGQPE